MNSNKEWAKHYDNLLLELAMYQLTEGLVKPVPDKERLFQKFSEFKSLVVRGSFTIKQLEDSVFGKYGIMPKEDLDYSHSIESFLEALEKLSLP